MFELFAINAFLGAVLWSRERGIVLRDREWSPEAERLTQSIGRHWRARG